MAATALGPTPAGASTAPPLDGWAAVPTPDEEALAYPAVFGEADSLTVTPAFGAVSDRIPIVVPPGRRGVEPSLALTFSSIAGLGDAGLGWSVSGLGEVELARRDGTPSVGEAGVFQFSVGGLGGELRDTGGGVYRASEEQAYREFRQLAGGGWEMRDGTGSRTYFGTTPETRALGSTGEVQRWLLERAEDASGNSITYQYVVDGGSHHIREIRYTGHVPTSDPGSHQVLFDYESRDDPRVSYRSAARQELTRRLSGITVNAGPSLVRRYELGYEQHPLNGQSLLSRVTLVGADDASRTVLREVEYSTRSLGWSEASEGIPFDLADAEGNDTGTRVADVNGDGFADVVTNAAEVRLGDGSGTFSLDPGWSASAAAFLAASRVGSWPSSLGALGLFEVTVDGHKGGDSGVRLQDLNGDALPDLFYARTAFSAGTFPLFSHLVWLNTGVGWQLDDTWTASLADAKDPNPWTGPGVGDGLEPVSFVDCGIGEDGPGRGIPAWRGAQLADVNGDGLVDIVWAERNTELEKYSPCTLLGFGEYDHVSVFLNTGEGWTRSGELSDALREMRGPEGTWFVVDGQLQGFDLLDVNGDGMADVVRTLEHEPKEVYLATGHGWTRDAASSDSLAATPIVSLRCDADPCSSGTDSKRTGAGMIPADVDDDGLVDLLQARAQEPPLAYRNTGTGWEHAPDMEAQLTAMDLAFVTADGKSTGTTLADVDGDGLTDFVRAQDGDRRTWVSRALRSGLLTGTTGALGEATELEWGSSTGFDNRRVDGVVEGLPMSLPLPLALARRAGLVDEAETRFRYWGGLFSDRAFRGFRVTTETAPTQAVTETEHYQDDGRIGLVKVRRSLGSDATVRGTLVSDYQQVDVGPQVRQTTLGSTTETIEGSSGAHTIVVDYAYDDRLNTTLIRRDPDAGVPGDETVAVVSFVRDDTAAIWSLPVRTVVSSSIGTVVSEQTNLYDGMAEGEVSRGLPTTITQKVDGSSVVSRSLSYDEYGAMVAETDPDGAVTRYEYDPTRTYRVAATDAEGREIRSTYDGRFGVLVSDTDAAGNAEVRSYDAFGRLARIDLPGDGPESAGIWTYSYSEVGTPGTQNYRVEEASVDGVRATLSTTYYFDGFGRIVRTERSGSGDRTVVRTASFDESGNVVATSRPFYAGDVPAMTTMRYDDQNRPVESIEPDGTTISMGYDGLRVDVTGPRGATTSYEKNADGDVAVVTEWVDGVAQATRYAYDAAGRLVSVTDPLGSTTRIGYDLLGRRISLEDPNVGRSTYTYEGDRLVAQTAPDGGTTRYAYSPTGDLVREELPSGAVHTFTYGPAGSGNGTGRIVRVEDPTGSVDLTYDPRGNATSRLRSVGDRQYETRYAYDGLDRLLSASYPDGYEVSYQYGGGGELARVSDNTGRDVLTDFRYTASGQLEHVRYGNGVDARYTYDQLQRMATADGTAADGTAVQSLGYRYDPASNVSAITDAVTGDDQAFEYDELDRLTRATGAYGDRRYVYDAGGNLVRKGDVFFQTDGDRPQRVNCLVDTAPDPGERVGAGAAACPVDGLPPALSGTQVSALAYDGRGNVVQKGDERYEYSDRNQLLRVRAADGAVTEANTYDAFGELVTKATTAQSTVFVDGIYEEVRGPDTVVARHHVYAGSMLVATFETVTQQSGELEPGPPEPSRPSTLPTTGAPIAALIMLAGALLAGGGAARRAVIRRRATTTTGRSPREARDRASATTAMVVGIALLAYGLTGTAAQPTTQPVVPDSMAGAELAGVTRTTVEGDRVVSDRDFYYHANHLGSIDAITDATGTVVERRAFEPYGERSGWDGPTASPSGQRAAFGGHPADETTPLVDFGARHYDPELGRFLSPDTEVGDHTDPAAMNRYAFAGGNPIRYIDPTGHRWYDWLIGVAVFLVVAALAIAVTIATGGTIWIAVAVIGIAAAIGATAAGLIGYYALDLRGTDLAEAIGTGFLIGGIIGAGIVCVPAAFASSSAWLVGMAADVAVGVAFGSIEKVVSHFAWEGGGPMQVSDFYQAWAVGAASGLVVGQLTRGLGALANSLGKAMKEGALAKYTVLPKYFAQASKSGRYAMPGGAPGAYVPKSLAHRVEGWLAGKFTAGPTSKLSYQGHKMAYARLIPLRPGVAQFGEDEFTSGGILSPLTYIVLVIKGVGYLASR